MLKLLIVDDEELIRLNLRALLEDLGNLTFGFFPFLDLKQLAQPLILGFQLGQALQIRGCRQLGILQLSVFFLQHSIYTPLITCSNHSL